MQLALCASWGAYTFRMPWCDLTELCIKHHHLVHVAKQTPKAWPCLCMSAWNAVPRSQNTTLLAFWWFGSQAWLGSAKLPLFGRYSFVIYPRMGWTGAPNIFGDPRWPMSNLQISRHGLWQTFNAGMYASQVWATPFSRQGKEMDNPLQKWLLTVLKRILMVKDTAPSWCIMRECGLEPLQFNWFQGAVWLYNALAQGKSSTARKNIQADMLLSSQCNDC